MTNQPTTPERDPRDVVTPHAFAVAPELLGRPLATPWRRGLALLVDLIAVFFLTQLSAVFFGAAAAGLFFYVVFRGARGHWLRRTARGAVAFAGAAAIFVGVLVVTYSPSAEEIEGNPYAMMSAGQWATFSRHIGSLDPEDRQQMAEELVVDLSSRGVSDSDLQDVIDDFDLPPGIDLGILLGGEPEAPEPVVPADPAAVADALEAYTVALREGDDEKVLALQPETRELVAGVEIARLKRHAEQLRDLTRNLRAEVRELRERVENPGFMRIVQSFGADLGLGFGWSGVYFVLFLAVWNGRTPGKYLFGLRVVRLDGSPLGLWRAFERFAGYAAGLATGLLGFAQVFWDANRQGVQDKIVGTVVIAERRGIGRSIR